MNINESSYKAIIYDSFDHTNDFEFLDLVAETLELVEDLSDATVTEIYDAASGIATFYRNQWTILRHYCTPETANWKKAFDMFCKELIALAGRIVKETSKEE